MGRTIRDITIYSRNLSEVQNAVFAWGNSHKAIVESNTGTFVRVRLPKSGTEKLASFVLENKKIIEITINQMPNAIVVHTEGFVKLGSEEEFSPNAVMGGVPKRIGWNAIQDLWQRLMTLSGSQGQSMPAPPQQPFKQQQQAAYPPPPPPPDNKVPPIIQPTYASPKVASSIDNQAKPSGVKPNFCPGCGYSLREQIKKTNFCPNCGEKLVD